MYTLGIDIGSTTSKCVILQDGASITARSLQLGGLGTDGPEDALTELWQESGLTRADMARVIVTGYGRNKFEGADGRGQRTDLPRAGGPVRVPRSADGHRHWRSGCQDHLPDPGRPHEQLHHERQVRRRNRPVSGGHGQHSAAGYRRSGRHRRRERHPRAISSTCTVFAESEVISQLANGVKRPDLVAGICQSVATRVASLARRAGIVERVCMSGGVARNEAVRRYMAQALDVEISYDPLAQYFGAIGAALYAWKQASK